MSTKRVARWTSILPIALRNVIPTRPLFDPKLCSYGATYQFKLVHLSVSAGVLRADLLVRAAINDSWNMNLVIHPTFLLNDIEHLSSLQFKVVKQTPVEVFTKLNLNFEARCTTVECASPSHNCTTTLSFRTWMPVTVSQPVSSPSPLFCCICGATGHSPSYCCEAGGVVRVALRWDHLFDRNQIHDLHISKLRIPIVPVIPDDDINYEVIQLLN